MDLVNEFENLQRHNEAKRSPAAQKRASEPVVSKLRAILRDEKTQIGLANTLGGFAVFVAYVVTL